MRTQCPPEQAGLDPKALLPCPPNPRSRGHPSEQCLCGTQRKEELTPAGLLSQGQGSRETRCELGLRAGPSCIPNWLFKELLACNPGSTPPPRTPVQSHLKFRRPL